MGKQELEELLKKQRGLLSNKSLVANLPDKGEKIKNRIKEIEEQLCEHKTDEVESMTAVLESLKIVEKRPSAAFFKKKEVQDTKDKEKKKEKFQAHRTKNYNEKAKENQPIKMLTIDQERAACEQTLNRIDEAEKAKQLASSKARHKVPIILESEPKWRDHVEIDLEDSDDEIVETGLE